MIITKVDDSTIQVEKEETKTSTNRYDYDFLLSQKEAIKKQAKEYAEARQVELNEVEFLLSEADKLGVKSRPVEIGNL
jgi:hypothetical protein